MKEKMSRKVLAAGCAIGILAVVMNGCGRGGAQYRKSLQQTAVKLEGEKQVAEALLSTCSALWQTAIARAIAMEKERDERLAETMSKISSSDESYSTRIASLKKIASEGEMINFGKYPGFEDAIKLYQAGLEANKEILDETMKYWTQKKEKASKSSYLGYLAKLCDDAMIDMSNYYQKGIELSQSFGTFKHAHSEIEGELKKLRNPSPEYKEAYEQLLDAYSAYSQMYDLCLSPEGSLKSFNAKIDKLKSDFDGNFSKLKILTGD